MKMVDVINEDTNAVVGQVPKFDGPEISAMVDTAFAVQPDWEKVPLFERGAILYRFCDLVDAHRDEIATAMSNEMGKPIMQARAETIMEP